MARDLDDRYSASAGLRAAVPSPSALIAMVYNNGLAGSGVSSFFGCTI
jgi:hypothetical protein